MSRRSKWLVFGVLTAAGAVLAGLSGSYVVPLDHRAIEYQTRPVTDPVARLGQEVNAGKRTLEFDDQTGYLRSVLQALKIPLESQVLVFSKTSFQAARIAPRLPRALYFNDSVSVGFVRGGDVLEFASVDPKQGVIFYTLEQDSAAKPRFERRDNSCLQCHATGSTLGVPGLVVRSVFPDASGMPQFQAGSFVTNHRSPLKERWGGWYVTGTHGKQVHMGNAVVADPGAVGKLQTEGTQNVTDLRSKFDVGAYLTPHSDIAALMVLEHQTYMTNAIIRVGFEVRMALQEQLDMNKALGEPESHVSDSTNHRIDSVADELVDYMLFEGEAQLTEPIHGSSKFTETFSRMGPFDQQRRSLRQLDLSRRLFKYPCSFLIYSEAFDNLPERARTRIWKRLWDILHGEDKTRKFAYLSAEDRTAILDIIRATKTGLPDYWT